MMTLDFFLPVLDNKRLKVDGILQGGFQANVNSKGLVSMWIRNDTRKKSVIFLLTIVHKLHF